MNRPNCNIPDCCLVPTFEHHKHDSKSPRAQLAMKTTLKKQTILLALGSFLLLSSIQVNNVKLIMDSQALLGFELDFSEMELSFSIPSSEPSPATSRP